MKNRGVLELIQVDDYSATPKYLQLTNSILKAIEEGKIKEGQVLPSINELSYEFEIARDTAEKGYRHLKKIGVLGSVPGKGYFIKSTDFQRHLKVFLLFNKLSAHKKIVYDAFVRELGDNVTIDFYIYNNDLSLFKKLINEKKDDYTHYVIVPHFIEGNEKASHIINTLPKEKLILLDKKIKGIDGHFAAVYEDFANNIYHALEEAIESLSKYHTIKLMFPKDSYYPKEIIEGFERFCSEYAFSSKVINSLSKETIQEGEVYITIMEDDLVQLIERIIAQELKVGEQVGIISYNETPIKKIILNGITTISTDFYKMGVYAAQSILNNQHQDIEVPFSINLRASL